MNDIPNEAIVIKAYAILAKIKTAQRNGGGNAAQGKQNAAKQDAHNAATKQAAMAAHPELFRQAEKYTEAMYKNAQRGGVKNSVRIIGIV